MTKRRDPDWAALLAAAAAPDPERDSDERGLEAVLAAYREAADAPVRETDMMGVIEREPTAAGAAGATTAAGAAGAATGSAASTRSSSRAPMGHRFTRALAVKCAAVLVLLAGTGMAVPGAGMLPAPMQ